MNMSSPSICPVELRAEEFLAEKWGQKDKKEIHFSALIFLPFRLPPS